MRLILLAGLLAAAPSFASTLVARQGDDSVRFFDQPCTSELVLGRLAPAAYEQFRAAFARFQGQDYTACWAVMGGSYYLVYEDGDQGIIPAHEVKEDESI